MSGNDKAQQPNAESASSGSGSGISSSPVAKAAAGAALALFASLCLAATPTLARVAYDHGSDAATVSLVRFSVAALGFCILMRVRGQRLPRDRRFLWAGAAIGVCYAVQTVAYLSSVQFVTVPVAVLVFFTFPVIAALLVRIVDRTPLSRDKLAAVSLAFLGVALATGAAPHLPDLRGVGLAFLAAIGTAAYIVFGARIARQNGPLAINALALSIAAALMTVNAALLTPPALPQGAAGWMGLAASGVLFLIGILTFFMALTILDTLRATLLANSEPFFAIVIAFVVLGEMLTLAQAAGALLVVAGVLSPQVATAVRQRRDRRPSTRSRSADPAPTTNED